MSDEIKAAAERRACERLRRINAGISEKDKIELYGTAEAPKMRLGKWGHYEALDLANAWVADDCETLADAYLSEHDETPITEEWLRSVGFEEVPSENWPSEYRKKFRDRPPHPPSQFDYLVISAPSKEHWDWGFKATVAAAGCWPGPLATKGDVRRLCAGLGIPLAAKGTS